MRLRILERSKHRLSPQRWSGRTRRFTAVHCGLEALWSQGLALRMSLPTEALEVTPPKAPTDNATNGNETPPPADEPAPSRSVDRAHAALRQWRSYVGVFLFENVRAERVPDAFADDLPVDEDRLRARLREEGAEALYDVCLGALADVAHQMRDDDVLPEPRALDEAAEQCDAPIECVIAIKVRGIPRIV